MVHEDIVLGYIRRFFQVIFTVVGQNSPPPIILKLILSLIMFPALELILPLIRLCEYRRGTFFSCRMFFPWTFCPHGRFVPPVVLSPDVMSLQTFCHSGRLVPPDVFPQTFFPLDVLSLRMFFPTDVLSPNVRSLDVLLPNVLPRHRKNN